MFCTITSRDISTLWTYSNIKNIELFNFSLMQNDKMKCNLKPELYKQSQIVGLDHILLVKIQRSSSQPIISSQCSKLGFLPTLPNEI